jgi:diguanylate cyclase (GGDEF)-like protein
MPLRDPLTRLPAEALFQDRLEQAVALARRRQGRIAVIQLAITGVGAPDSQAELLIALARRLEQDLRASDTVSRTGDADFTVLLNDVDSRPAARAVAEELVMAAAKPLQIGERRYHLDAGYGLALFPEDGDSAAEVLRAAVDALRRTQAE